MEKTKAAPKAAKAAKEEKKAVAKEEQKTEVGKVTHYFTEISVAVIEVKSSMKVGDTISIEGATTNLKQKIDSMQIEKLKITEAKKGQAIGMKVKDRVRPGDVVYKVK